MNLTEKPIIVKYNNKSYIRYEYTSCFGTTFFYYMLYDIEDKINNYKLDTNMIYDEKTIKILNILYNRQLKIKEIFDI